MNDFKILLCDDDDDSRDVLAVFISEILGIKVRECRNGLEAIEEFDRNDYSLVVSDIKMPVKNGLDLLHEIKTIRKSACPVVLMTGFAELDVAVAALRNGAEDFVQKPVDVNYLYEIIEKLRNIDTKVPEEQDIKAINKNFGSYIFIDRIGKVGIFSKSFADSISSAEMFASDRSMAVLIEGETGTGKEIIANIIHGNDKRLPFISVNCSAIAPHLFESELFGYVGGAFTGAKSSGMKGKFEAASGGTLFLDEIGDMPLELQPKLLRVLQDRTIYKIGSSNPIDVDVRIVAATNKNLRHLVAEGKFREDLYHRLNVGFVRLEPLRSQKEAIVPLAQMMLTDFSKKRGKDFRLISKEAATILESYDWKGNIRELSNLIERIVLLFNASSLRPEHLEMLNISYSDSFFVLSPKSKFALPPDKLDIQELEQKIVSLAMEKFRGNKSKVAEYLGLTRSSLRSRL